MHATPEQLIFINSHILLKGKFINDNMEWINLFKMHLSITLALDVPTALIALDALSKDV